MSLRRRGHLSATSGEKWKLSDTSLFAAAHRADFCLRAVGSVVGERQIHENLREPPGEIALFRLKSLAPWGWRLTGRLKHADDSKDELGAYGVRTKSIPLPIM